MDFADDGLLIATNETCLGRPEELLHAIDEALLFESATSNEEMIDPLAGSIHSLRSDDPLVLERAKLQRCG